MIRLRFLLSLILIISLFCFCTKKEEKTGDTEHTLISAYTSGTISRTSPIRVQFAAEIVDSGTVRQPMKKSPFDFDPSIDGIAIWTGTSTLEFRPEKRLPANKSYEATLHLKRFMETFAGQETFRFSFSTIEPSFDLSIEGLETPRSDQPLIQRIKGEIITADAEFAADVEKMITAKQEKRALDIGWQHSNDQRHHIFTVKGIKRQEDSSFVRLEWSGRPIGVNKRGDRIIPVPAQSDFKLISVSAQQGETQYVEVRFSDPLLPSQNLSGLLRTDDKKEDLKYRISGNVIRIYSSKSWTGEAKVSVEPGIRNMAGYRLKTGGTYTLFFQKIKPEVRFAGDRVIIPSTLGTTIPIKTVNLKAVIVKAIRIKETNLPQFLQVNDLGGERELRRVGEIVWHEEISLNFTPDMANRWIQYGLDVSPLIEQHPGGLYRLELSFVRKHIVYDCPDKAEDEELDLQQSWEDDASSYWDSYGSYDYGEYYRNRRNPCHPAYYRHYYDHDIRVARNFLISDIGLIAKKGQSDSVMAVVTDLRTARPLAGVHIQLGDFQQSVLDNAVSDKNGIVFLSAVHKPFLLIAEKNGQRGYLKLDDGSSLSVSHFDVDGQVIEKGLKGYLYGERGIWRPGDTIYLTFILYNANKPLPQNYPIQFELENPRGQRVNFSKKVRSVNGFYTFKLNTATDAPTGKWLARIKAGGVTFEKSLSIETVRPNRLKIEVDFGSGEQLTEGTIVGTIQSAWLHGAVAQNLKTDVELALGARNTQFKGYGAFEFDDPVKRYEPQNQMIYEGRLDPNGKATFRSIVKSDDASSGMLTARFITRVFEQSGAFSIDRTDMPFHPYNRYIGILAPKGDKARGMLLTDTTHAVQLVALDHKGNLIRNADVMIKLYKIKWRWWWEKGSENLADYVGTSSYQPIDIDTVHLANGRGEYKLRLSHPQWGRFLIRAHDIGGDHSTGKIVYIDWPGWAGRGQKDLSGGAAVLSFSADKSEYRVGETVSLTIPTAKDGRGLLSLETGKGILFSDWINAGGESIQYSFQATTAMAPNVYVHITYLQPHLQSSNDLPIRLYGVIPIKVFNPETILTPVIECDNVFRPEESVRVSIREKNGRAMTYTLALVDEGLLDLTRFSTPNAWNAFYQREALGVKTWDLYDMIAGAHSGRLERLLAVGGDGSEEQVQGGRRANRFPPMVKFFGPVELKKNQVRHHDIDMPQYVGSVRVMAVAGMRDAFGSDDKTVAVRKPLMVLGTLPRVLGPQESVDLPVTVFALEENIRSVDVNIRTAEPLTVKGNPNQNLGFAQTGDKMAYFDLQAENEGIGTVRILAQSKDEKAEQSIEIEIRNPMQPVVDVLDTVLQAGETWSEKIALSGIAGSNEAMLEISRIPPLNLTKRLGFLVRYPYGCIEQTTSAAFPQLYLKKLLDLSLQRQKEIEKNVKDAIAGIQNFQTFEGGFSTWPGGDADQWSSTWAGHFLVEAQKLGYAVPMGTLSQWQKYQRNRAFSWVTGSPRSELQQAYRLFTLALYGNPELGAMNRLREIDNLPVVARWRLAAAYYLAGQPEAATELVDNAPLSVETYHELGNTYGSALRDEAMILESLLIMKDSERAEPLIQKISNRLSDDVWLSTQTTAYALIALARYAGVGVGDDEMECHYSWQNEEKTATTAAPVLQQSLSVYDATKASFRLKNQNRFPLYPRLVLTGTPAMGAEKAAQQGLNLQVQYETLEGEALDPSLLPQGLDFVANATVTHSGSRTAYEGLALSQLFPSGWEIRNERMDPSMRAEDSEFTYQDVRDDRVYTYFDLKKGESKTFRVLLNAGYSGRFYLPMVQVEAMYDATINAREPGQWIRVVKPGTDE
ncbi:hypothetical protein GF407_02805 [candidate division KSB1 bacterium]|nr:hypothetical protein [candidate division KSB1 bacterium]